MKKTKVLFKSLLILVICFISFSNVYAHFIALDPDSLISFPWWITNGSGTITIDDEITGYSLFYQALEIPNDVYIQIETIRTEGEKDLEALDAELETLKEEKNNLRTVYDEAFDAYEAKVKNNDSENEIEQAKTAYETARITWQNKVTEYNNKVDEYNTKEDEIENDVNALVPSYVESNWIKTEDRSFSVDLSQFSGNKAFAIWAKLVCSDGTVAYDEATYAMSGTKPQEIAVEKITLDKSEITITEGSTYTLNSIIIPANATNTLVIWSSDNEKVATVEDGKITAISEGTATITATTKDGGYSNTCKVTVTKKVATSSKENNESDASTADKKLPDTGSLAYITIFIILVLNVLAAITYKKVKYLSFK